jgi:hypothetical protein
MAASERPANAVSALPCRGKDERSPLPWEICCDFHLYERNIGNGCCPARLLAGLKFSNMFGFNFMEVKTNGLLSEWRFGGFSGPVTETNRGNGWENARLIG